jgi:hypothetical protein
MAAMSVSSVRVDNLAGDTPEDDGALQECAVAYGDQLGHAITLVYVERLLEPVRRRTVAILVTGKGSVVCALEDVRVEFNPDDAAYNMWVRTADACTDDEYCILFVKLYPSLQFVLLKAAWDDEAKARMQTDIGADKLQLINEHLTF